MNGYELCKEIKGILICVIFGYFPYRRNDLESKINGLKIGAGSLCGETFFFQLFEEVRFCLYSAIVERT